MSGDNQETISAICTTLNCHTGLHEAIAYFAGFCERGILQEIVIVDGGSTDGSWELLKELSDEMDFLRVFSRPGLNISQGRNECVAQMKGQIALCFDSGCSYADDYVLKMLEPFKGSDPPDVVGGGTITMGLTPFEVTFARMTDRSTTDRRMPSHRAVAYRRNVFEAVGGYDESVQAGEDSHFNAVWLRAGFKWRYVPEAKVFWRMRSSLGQCYRMSRRNTRGHVALGERYGAMQYLFRLGLYGSIVALCVLTIFSIWTLVAAGMVAFGYWSFRLFRKGRWRYFAKPWNYVIGVLIILATDIGTMVGVAYGLVELIHRRLLIMSPGRKQP